MLVLGAGTQANSNKTEFQIWQWVHTAEHQPWVQFHTNLPDVLDLLSINQFIDFMDIDVSDSDTTPYKLAITYGYRHGTLPDVDTVGNSQNNILVLNGYEYYYDIGLWPYTANTVSNKRSFVPPTGQPGSADNSREHYSFTLILCPELTCSTYVTRQLFGAQRIFNRDFGSVPYGVRVSLSSKVNDGNPVVAFAVAGAPPDFEYGRESSYLHSDQGYFFFGRSFVGGNIALLHCNDKSCSSASLVRTSDALAGHTGNFVLLSTAEGVLVGSIPHWGVNRGPNFQFFQNQYASPNGQRCSDATAGTFVVADEEVYVCTKFPASILLDDVTIYYWTHVSPSLKSTTMIGIPRQRNMM